MIDERVKEALYSSVEDEAQRPEIATRLIAWLEAVSEGRESLADKEQTALRLESLFQATSVKLDSEEVEGLWA